MTAAEKAREKELTRRRRVVHGWAFRDLDKELVVQIRAWISGETDECPEHYARLNETVQ